MNQQTAMAAPAVLSMPGWVPAAARSYLSHTEAGVPIRGLARDAGCHASTILRQVRRIEQRRDDPLVDQALAALAAHLNGDGPALPATAEVEGEAARVLRRLCESGAMLATVAGMDQAVVVRDGPDGGASRTAVVARRIAEAMALNDWIASAEPAAKLARYRITPQGRSDLRLLMARTENAAAGRPQRGLAEAATPFAPAPETEDRCARPILSESPLYCLARRRDRDGRPFLTRGLIEAGERLREDFELSQIGPAVTQDWDRFLVAGASLGQGARSEGSNAAAARARVAAALAELGPGLGDVALRCCCFLEGMEQAERRMGWSARSGKIVLRIALQRLRRHYDDQGLAPRMG